MRIIAGKQVFETLVELVQHEHTALVLVDFQNDLVAANGIVDKRGERAADLIKVVSCAQSVLQRAREIGIGIFFIRMLRKPGHGSESPASLRWLVAKRGYSEQAVSAVEGTWGCEIAAELAPRKGEHIVGKRRASAFFDTDLDKLLKAKDVQTIVLVGVSTHGCVESTARDAQLRDYHVVVLEDAVGAYNKALHEAALTVMRSRYEVVTSAELLGAWRVPAIDTEPALARASTGT